MSWDGTITCGFNDDGFGAYNYGMTVDIHSNGTDTMDDTLELIKKVAREYCREEIEKGWEMPYPWNWGDVFNEVPAEVFASYGISANSYTSQIIPHDEIVVDE